MRLNGSYSKGIKGCCQNNIQPEQIKRVINVILQGELWIRRTLTNQILDELVKVTHEKDRIDKAINELLDNLTRREYQIATLVGRGESNKRIAQQLAITERTVKAHLTEIFRKLYFDRVKLALIMKDAMRSPEQTLQR
jgi:DNA-binding NarL/FixJ family response regulator